MDEPVAEFHRIVKGLLDRIAAEEASALRRVGEVLAGVIAADHLLYVFGTGGHSYIGAEEMTWRAGGLAAVHPVFDPGVSLSFGARRSSAVERTPGYAQAVLGGYHITAQDALIIVNAYGINACTIDAALWARERGIPTVGITSPDFSRSIPRDHPARHPSGKNLFELVTHVLDSKMPHGDAVLQFPGLQPWVGPVSTILNAFVIESLVAEIVNALLRRKTPPPVWTSGNIPGGDAANKGLMERYVGRIRWL